MASAQLLLSASELNGRCEFARLGHARRRFFRSYAAAGTHKRAAASKGDRAFGETVTYLRSNSTL
jgi:hypothetical protein